MLTDAANDAAQGELDKCVAIRKQLVEQHPRILQDPLITKALTDVDSALDAGASEERISASTCWRQPVRA